MKKFFYKNILRTIYKFFIIFKKEYYFNLYRYIVDVFRFIKEYKTFLKENNPKYRVSNNYFLPCSKDKTEKALVEPIYFFQDT